MGQVLPKVRDVTNLIERQSKPIILSDLDDVVLDSTSRFIQEVNRRYGINADWSDITDAELTSFSKKYGIPAKELYELYAGLLCEGEFARSITEVPGASSYLKQLRADNPKLNIQIVSGRPSKGRSYVERSLEERGIPYDALFLTDQDAETSLSSDTVKTKDDLVDRLSPNIVIEDSPRLIPKTLEKSMGGDLYTVLFERGWTKDFLRKKGIERDVERSDNIEIVSEPYWENAYPLIRRYLGDRR